MDIAIAFFIDLRVFSGVIGRINAPVAVHLVTEPQQHRMFKFGNGLRIAGKVGIVFPV